MKAELRATMGVDLSKKIEAEMMRDGQGRRGNSRNAAITVAMRKVTAHKSANIIYNIIVKVHCVLSPCYSIRN